MRIVYLDIDTLRADHLGCSGYARNTTPNIDALAREGVRFANVYASDVPCLPSRTALSTGQFGIRNGVVNHGGLAADLRLQGASRSFFSAWFRDAWASALYRTGFHTTSFSSFPFRHSASWWNNGFIEAMNLMRGMGNETKDQVMPHVLDWLDRRGRSDQWFLHVHLWDPHTPYNTPDEYGNPFAGDPIPAWHTEEVRERNWGFSGPHSAQELWGFSPDDIWGPPPPGQPAQAASMDDVKAIFDGYDLGIRYADDALGSLMAKLEDLGVLDDTAVLVSSDHGEAFGELGVYTDHQAADEATCHIPAVLKWPGVEPAVHEGLQYHLDVAATILELAGAQVPQNWDGSAITINGAGRDHVVVSQGAWSCQRGVRWDDYLFLRTWHDGYHGHWSEEMLFDVAQDPHETQDLRGTEPALAKEGLDLLERWTTQQLERTGDVDPLDTVLSEGGPMHTRHQLPDYLPRLRATGRGHWADVLVDRHPDEL
jgi:arylsulfatase A-like enzyme